jgi:hypothetical protein
MREIPYYKSEKTKLASANSVSSYKLTREQS